MTADIIIGLGFGDEGKGLVTDYICSRYNPREVLVIRFSGGQQAGHTVVYNGVRHICSNYGSGVLRDIPSYFTEHCSVYLNTIYREKQCLASKGVLYPRLSIHPLAMLTTPYDVAYNRVREKKLEHGSCGLGIAATAHRHITTPYKLYAADLLHKGVLEAKLFGIHQYYRDLMAGLPMDVFDGYANKEMLLFLQTARKYEALFSIEGYDYLERFRRLVCEGSQGVLLDKDHGIFPNVTYADTTSKNAWEVVKARVSELQPWHVTRCYQTRHGNGWMSSEQPMKLINNNNETNVFNPWQRGLRTGELDYDLLNYAMAVDSSYSYYNYANLVVTCMDQRAGFIFEQDKIKRKPKNLFYSFSDRADGIVQAVACHV